MIEGYDLELICEKADSFIRLNVKPSDPNNVGLFPASLGVNTYLNLKTGRDENILEPVL